MFLVTVISQDFFHLRVFCTKKLQQHRAITIIMTIGLAAGKHLVVTTYNNARSHRQKLMSARARYENSYTTDNRS